MKKVIVIGVIALFIVVGFQPAFAVESKSSIDAVKDEEVLSSISQGRKIIYVDDDNTEGPWEGTQEHPYRRIGDAVDAANESDTIYVYSGTYNEWIRLHKQLFIKGIKYPSIALFHLNSISKNVFF